MKAVWKGYLTCSLVTIPIKMFNTVAKSSLAALRVEAPPIPG